MSQLPPRIMLEVCVASTRDAVAAEAAGADRLELNVGLEIGGLTPSVGLLQEVKNAVTIPVIAMVRPRAAGFRYSGREKCLMMRDAELLLEHGADGVAAGALGEDGRLDEGFWPKFRTQADDREVVFHRAFDVAADRAFVLQQLIDSRTTRVLTSGGEPTAQAGRAEIRRMVQLAHDKIQILPGSGIATDNVTGLLRETGCKQVHGTFREWRSDPAGTVAADEYPATSQTLVADIRRILDRGDGVMD